MQLLAARQRGVPQYGPAEVHTWRQAFDECTTEPAPEHTAWEHGVPDGIAAARAARVVYDIYGDGREHSEGGEATWACLPHVGADGFAVNGASTGVDTRDTEVDLARAGQAVVDAALSDAPEALRMPPERLAFFLSCLRQAMEQELVQLRLTATCPSAALTDALCARHVNLIIENHPLSGSKGLETFKAWAVKTARGPILRGLLKLLNFDLPKRRF